MKRKSTSIILILSIVLTMVLTLLPTAAASEVSDEPEKPYYTISGNTGFRTVTIFGTAVNKFYIIEAYTGTSVMTAPAVIQCIQAGEDSDTVTFYCNTDVTKLLIWESDHELTFSRGIPNTTGMRAVLGDGITASYTSYAYITSSSVDREEYSHSSNAPATEGQWIWYRNAIVDGYKVSLTETGASLNVLGNLVQGKWYEVEFNANGDVYRASRIGEGAYAYTSSGKYINNTANVETAVNSNNSTVLLHDQTTVSQLIFKNGTLYTSTNDTRGFHVGADVRIVVANANRAGTAEFNDVTDGYVGYTGLEKAIHDMNCRGIASAAGVIELSAIMTNGSATTIVINDKSPAASGIIPNPPGPETAMGVFIDSEWRAVRPLEGGSQRKRRRSPVAVLRGERHSDRHRTRSCAGGRLLRRRRGRDNGETG